MQLFVAGIAHFDPLCRQRLQKWLKHLLRRYANAPGFVAVEWDKEIFLKVKSQRPIVRALAESRWPSGTPAFLDALAAAVAYEADTHLEIMPAVQTVWLDHDRSLPYPHAVNTYAACRISIYSSFIPPTATRFNSALLQEMCRESWNRFAARDKGGNERDIRFTEAITHHAKSSRSDWALAIVGANHASRDTGYMVQRVETAGIPCETNELRPSRNAA